ncbi:uncharacterized protein LOC133681948 [Populus nigra]|uniref:uncharacterized protein LOC133681948 n=1 Tax=Populus nigra TaxID=3691 RepID=UPI002B279631|nr:uncharacterized protein LOC133681948 [Populus nigra]
MDLHPFSAPLLLFFLWQICRLRKEWWRLEAGAAGAAALEGGAAAVGGRRCCTGWWSNRRWLALLLSSAAAALGGGDGYGAAGIGRAGEEGNDGREREEGACVGLLVCGWERGKGRSGLCSGCQEGEGLCGCFGAGNERGMRLLRVAGEGKAAGWPVRETLMDGGRRLLLSLGRSGGGWRPELRVQRRLREELLLLEDGAAAQAGGATGSVGGRNCRGWWRVGGVRSCWWQRWLALLLSSAAAALGGGDGYDAAGIGREGEEGNGGREREEGACVGLLVCG